MMKKYLINCDVVLSTGQSIFSQSLQSRLSFRYLPALLFLLMLSSLVSAVQLSTNDRGQVLIFPYYTVNNNLNTAYTVVNTTDQPKAIKLTFREGDAGLRVLSFDVYLSAFDVWTGIMGPTTSTFQGHVGEDSGLHASADASCAPYLHKFSQEFLPFEIEQDLVFSNKSMSRARHGYFEVIEMGVLTGEAAAHATHNSTGEPAACFALQASWDDDEWDFDPLSEPTGGLQGTAFIVNVAEGLSMSYDAIAIDHFWDQQGIHSSPGSALPDLGSGSTESRVLLDDGRLAISEWDSGFQAVSAVLMHTEVINEYALDSIVAGKTEWVVTFPTKHHHVNVNNSQNPTPFTQRWNGLQSCDEFELGIWDREAQKDPPFTCGGVTCPPRPPAPELCYATNVLTFRLPQPGTPSSISDILGAEKNILMGGPSLSHATENGWARLTFDVGHHVLNPSSGTGYLGLPVTGFSAQQFTNAAAGEGLLAQYGNIHRHKGRVTLAGQN
ncbi:hypothetical protein ACFODZ_09830 [Marinicella sediminis]|uniref:Uncharacterized protein n=1 Tax=Marinicella sediminis TaxID=1792834 RepID=A0ABV7J8U0_9GAMM|nr:hypothetical protein [Marinicella sediminis]